MIAQCISNHSQLKKTHEVFKYEDCYVCNSSSKSMPYIVFEPRDVDINEIAEGYKYCYYEIEGKLYESVLTNDYKAIIPKSKGYTQLSLF